MPEREIQQLSIDTIRGLAMDAVQRADSGHPGTAMALAPLAYTLFERFLRVNPTDTGWPDRDRFVLSAGHACVLQYSLLHLAGFELSLDDLRQFRQWGSRTPGHPERGHTPGIEVTTGPLGQGLGNAVGMAVAERFLADRFNRPGLEVVDHHVYAICSDGDLMEGVSQEAASIAGHFALGKLIVCYDDNHITIDGTTAISFDGEEHLQRFDAEGWHVQHVEDSEDLDSLHGALEQARDEDERPSFIAIRSHIAYPAPHAVDTAKAHGAALGEDEVRATKEVMGFDPGREFWVDERVYQHMSLRESGAAAQRQWKESRFDPWRAAYPDMASDWDLAFEGRLRDGWREALPSFAAGEKIATRSAGQRAMAAFGEFAPTMIGGAADLVESTKTVFEGAGEFSDVHAGRNVPFGIREHAMGAIVNGAAAHGGIVKPYGSTFLIFSDYMRPSVRLSALMGLPVLWVWTHDSVGLGEDGPTHQPIEHYAALRAIPRLWVIRPADANETSVAWRVALEREDGPVALLLSRQNIPVLDRDEAGERGGARTRRLRAVGLRRGTLAGRRRGLRSGRSRRDPDRHRRRGFTHARGWASGCRGGRARTRRVDALHGAVRGPVAGVPRRGPTPRGGRPPGGRARSHDELVEVGGVRGGRARPGSLRRLGAGNNRAGGAGFQRGEHRRARASARRAGDFDIELTKEVGQDDV